MRRRTKVDKCIDLLEEILNDHHFHPALMANIIITTYPPYTQKKLIELIRYLEEYHMEEQALDKLARTGEYTRVSPVNKPDTSWVHDRFYGESAHIRVQAQI